MADGVVDLAAHRETLVKAATEANSEHVIGLVTDIVANDRDAPGVIYTLFVACARLLANDGCPLHLLRTELDRAEQEVGQQEWEQKLRNRPAVAEKPPK